MVIVNVRQYFFMGRFTVYRRSAVSDRHRNTRSRGKFNRSLCGHEAIFG
jgi:hypothetical protein